MAIEGLSRVPGEPLGSDWRSVFVGDLTNEFTVVGRWQWARGNGFEVNTGDAFAITMPIDFDDQSQPVIQIAPLDVSFADPAAPRQVITLERISSSIEFPD